MKSMNLEKNGSREENEIKKMNRPSRFKKFLATSAALMALWASTPMGSGCGEGIDTKTEFSGNVDGGTTQRPDSGTAQEEKKCKFREYAVLEIGSERQKVFYGEKVEIGYKKYTLRKSDVGPVLESSDGSLYVVDGDGTVVDENKVKFLGNGTTETNAMFIQLEYYDKEPKDYSAVIEIGKSEKFSIDNKHYVELSVNDIACTGKVCYADVKVNVFVESSSGTNTFVSIKSFPAQVDVNGSVLEVTADDGTQLLVNIDPLGAGTTNAKAVLNVGQERYTMDNGMKVTWNGEDFSIQLLDAFHSKDYSSAKIMVVSGNIVYVKTLMKGEVLTVETPRDKVDITLDGTKSACD
ncbi:MAG: hypothetical protein ACP5H8_02635 [Candidatus Micrarchaeia archaeon]